ncbi:transposase [Rhodococcus pyridinivorans]|uniref:transposase n=1 Tax=Rhodococcus pyridinivorans TaxID=103816 RepID=UPI003673CF87
MCRGGTTHGQGACRDAEWPAGRSTRPAYPVLFIDAIYVKIRDGQVTNQPVYVVVGSPPQVNATSAPANGRSPRACVPVMAVRARSSGWRCSPRSRTAVSRTRASPSATG